MEKKKVIVIGIDEFNRYELSQIENYERYEFITLLDPYKIQNKEQIDVEEIIQAVTKTIKDHDYNIDGILTFYDFPFTLVTFYLCEKYGFTGPSLMSGLKCEHKYWSRLEQKKAVPEHVPAFDEIDPFQPRDIEELNVSPPFWMKPVKTHSSRLGFKVSNESDFEEGLTRVKKNIHGFAEPFNYMFYKQELPEHIRKIDGFHCLTEDVLKGHQCTLSGYVYQNEVVTYGVVDSLFYEQAPSFLCYLLPSGLPDDVQQQLDEIAKKIMSHIGFNNSPFNIEFFYNKDTGEIKILEINPRISQSHGYIYNMVKGHSNHQVLVELALGERPNFVRNKGKYEYAAKFQYRIFHDGKVKELPTQQQIKEVEAQYPDAAIHINVKKGDILSNLKIHDPFSYCIGEILLAARSKKELFDKYDQIRKQLNIKIDKK